MEEELEGNEAFLVGGKARSETHPPADDHRRSVRSRESVHICPMSVGCGCEVIETN